jgi:hypothetical protein
VQDGLTLTPWGSSRVRTVAGQVTALDALPGDPTPPRSGTRSQGRWRVTCGSPSREAERRDRVLEVFGKRAVALCARVQVVDDRDVVGREAALPASRNRGQRKRLRAWANPCRLGHQLRIITSGQILAPFEDISCRSHVSGILHQADAFFRVERLHGLFHARDQTGAGA